MKAYLKLLIFLLAGFLLNNCEKNETEKSQGVIMPLKIGNYWKYLVYDYEEEAESTRVDSISTDSIIDGEKWFLLNGTNAFFSNRNNGLWDLVGFYSEELLMKYPAKVGDNWDISRPGLSVEINAQVVSVDTPVDINNEIFECYEYEYYENGLLKRKHYASPSIGIVKTKIYKSTTDDTVELVRQATLIEYNLN